MFKREERLGKDKDIKKVLRQSRRAMHPALMVRARRTDLSVVRSTVVVSSSVSKKATVRNRIKRQVRHQLRDLLKTAKGEAAGYDIMVTVKTPLLTTSTSERRAIITSLLNKAGIKVKPSVETN